MTPNEFRTGVISPIECMKEGWELIKDQYWLILGITVVGMLIAGFIPFGLGMGAMYCGIYYVLLRKMNGQPFEFGDLFKGFNYFIPGMIVSLILIVPILVSAVLLYGSIMAFIFAAIESNGRINEGVLYGMIVTVSIEAIIISLISGCLHALILFAYPLIVDRNLNGVDAFKLSAKAVWANLSGVVGIIMVEFVMFIIGFVGLAIGTYFLLPIMFAGVLVAYRRVFPSSQRFDQPPAPGFYQGV
jgi:hypothetical protein